MCAAEPCRVVDLEWDRGHESLTAIVRAESTTGVIVTVVHDLGSLPGHKWIRADELVSNEDLDGQSAVVRLAQLRGELTERVDCKLTNVVELLVSIHTVGSLLALYSERTGSEECLVGHISKLDPDAVSLVDLDTDGRVTGETWQVPIAEIIAIDWGTVYLCALEELLSAN